MSGYNAQGLSIQYINVMVHSYSSEVDTGVSKIWDIFLLSTVRKTVKMSM